MNFNVRSIPTLTTKPQSEKMRAIELVELFSRPSIKTLDASAVSKIDFTHLSQKIPCKAVVVLIGSNQAYLSSPTEGNGPSMLQQFKHATGNKVKLIVIHSLNELEKKNIPRGAHLIIVANNTGPGGCNGQICLELDSQTIPIAEVIDSVNQLEIIGVGSICIKKADDAVKQVALSVKGRKSPWIFLGEGEVIRDRMALYVLNIIQTYRELNELNELNKLNTSNKTVPSLHVTELFARILASSPMYFSILASSNEDLDRGNPIDAIIHSPPWKIEILHEENEPNEPNEQNAQNKKKIQLSRGPIRGVNADLVKSFEDARKSLSENKKNENNNTLSDAEKIKHVLFSCVQRGEALSVSCLVENLAYLNSIEAINATLPSGVTPLHIAAGTGNYWIAALLLKHGAQPEHANAAGATPLYIAARNGRIATIAILLTYEADINRANSCGESPLYAAARNGHTDAVEILVKEKADINQVGPRAATPLFIASQNGYVDIVKILVRNGANVNLPHSNGITPLYVAAQNGHVEVVKELVESNGISLDTPYNSATPVFIAAKNGHAGIVQILVDKRANIRHANADEQTPLRIASLNNHQKVVEILKKAGL